MGDEIDAVSGGSVRKISGKKDLKRSDVLLEKQVFYIKIQFKDVGKSKVCFARGGEQLNSL